MTEQIIQDTRKKKKGSNWKLGLKIGCSVILLFIVVVVCVGYFLIQDAMVAFDEIKKSEKQLIEKYGKVEIFCPEADGTIKAERMEVFLKVRENLIPLREELEKSLTQLLTEVSQAENEDSSIWGILKLIKDGSKVLPKAAKYFSTRNRKLLELGMGLGEYYYIYVMAYYAGLGISPDDGPDFSFLGAGNKNSSLYYAIQEMMKSKEEKKKEAEEGMHLETDAPRTVKHVRGIIFAMMQCQLKQVMGGGPEAEDNPESWQNLLAVEIEKMKKKRRRMPWQDGFPKVLEQSIQPYHERLKTSYIKLMNPIEFGLKKK